MEWLVWVGVALTVAGIAGLCWCILYTLRARKSGLADAELRRRLQKAVAVNLASLGVSALGLMAVILGIALG